jgi:hypothetical protein
MLEWFHLMIPRRTNYWRIFTTFQHKVEAQTAPQSFYPYPNLGSFRLGLWYWNGGVQTSQKSSESFWKSLVIQISIRRMFENQINKKLASEDGDAEEAG